MERRLHVIGGAEDKLGDREILRRFVDDAGGRDAKVLVVPTASSIQDEVVETYARAFADLGADRVRSIRPETRRGADLDEVVDLVDLATGIFLTGGNQAKLTALLAGTRFHEALRGAYESGVPIGGTSAGASVMASHMVFGGPKGDVAKAKGAQMGAGFDLLPNTIIDQHFGNRNRIGRLLTLVAQSPSHLGIGIDENTALVVTDEHRAEVVGDGVVWIVDGRHLHTDAFDVERNAALTISGAVLHQLPAGEVFDLRRRRLVADADLDDAQVTDAAEDFANATLDVARVRRVNRDSADDRLLAREARRRARDLEQVLATDPGATT